MIICIAKCDRCDAEFKIPEVIFHDSSELEGSMENSDWSVENNNFIPALNLHFCPECAAIREEERIELLLKDKAVPLSTFHIGQWQLIILCFIFLWLLGIWLYRHNARLGIYQNNKKQTGWVLTVDC